MKLKRILIFFVIILLLALLSIYYPRLTGEVIRYEKEPAFVTDVKDGDTLEANGTIRLLCINTPEKKKPYYWEAKEFLEKLENKDIEILRDKEDTDRYERKLRYVFYQDELINEEILKKGLGHVYLCDNLLYEKKMRKAEDFARKNQLGIWQSSEDKCADCILLKELNAEDEYFILENICSYDCDDMEVKDEANHFIKIEKINADSQETFKSKGRIWNNDGDRLFLRDKKGELMLYYSY